MFARMYAWSSRLLAAASQEPAPERSQASGVAGPSVPVYFLPAPRRAPDLSSNEMLLVRQGENGVLAGDLLERAGLGADAGRRALRSLFEKGVLTLSPGRAGDAWKWRALLPRDVQLPGKLPDIVRLPPGDSSARAASAMGRAPPPCLPRVAVPRAPATPPQAPSRNAESAPAAPPPSCESAARRQANPWTVFPSVRTKSIVPGVERPLFQRGQVLSQLAHAGRAGERDVGVRAREAEAGAVAGGRRLPGRHGHEAPFRAASPHRAAVVTNRVPIPR